MNQPTDQLSLQQHQDLVQWAIDYAMQVLHLFERCYPDDHRPRNALAAASKWMTGELSANEVRKYAYAAHSAAYDADDKAASAAALATGYAAFIVKKPAYAPYVATYAMKALSNSVSWKNTLRYRLLRNKAGLFDVIRRF